MGSGNGGKTPLRRLGNILSSPVGSEATPQPLTVFARDSIICYSAHMLSPVRPSVCLSVRHTGGSVKNA